MLEVILKNRHLNNLDKSKPVVLALSGGVDSMVLFDLLKKVGFNIIIAHVNHHKREESLAEEKYIRSFGEKFNTPVEVLDYFHETENFQAEAHNHRYNFFYQVAIKYNASSIITAHHYQDNLETIVMNIIKGSNIYGYAGIKDITTYNDMTVIRPLINVSKNDIYKYALENDITYFEDSSNASDDYLRNRIRHHVIPLLEKENPNLSNSVANYSHQLHEAFAYIRNNSVKYMVDNGNKIDINSFNNLALIQKKDIINYICDSRGILSSDNKICDILELIENPKPNLSYDLGNDFIFVKEYTACYIKKQDDNNFFRYEINLDEVIELPNCSFSLNKNITSETYLNISINEPLPLIIRKRCDGDRLIIRDGHKKLKDFLIDKKVPKNERDNLIVVTNYQGEIIWVLGYYKKKCDEENHLTLNCKEM